MKLDTTDNKILELLQADAKQTNKELSGKLNLSVTAVYERIKKLEKDWELYRGKKQFYQKWLDVEEILSYGELSEFEENAKNAMLDGLRSDIAMGVNFVKG